MNNSNIEAALNFIINNSDDEKACECAEYLLDYIEEFNLPPAGLKSNEEQEYDPSLVLPKELVGKENVIALFSDGASRGNPGPGSWGCIGQVSSGDILFESSSVELGVTNNQMELKGAINALKWVIEHDQFNKFEVFLYSDSKYVIDGISKWAPGWKKRGWKKADKKAPENLDLWKEFDGLVSLRSSICFRWVKGHNGHPQNEKCDSLANEALDNAGF